MKRVPSEKIKGKRVVKRYLGGLKGKKRIERAKEIVKRREEAKKGNASYKPFKTDKGVKTKPSKYTKLYKERYGNASKK